MKQVNLNVKNHKNFLNDSNIYSLYNQFQTIIQKKISRNKFIVAVSGGPDSLVLAYFASEYSRQNKIQVEAVIVDHAIRKNSSQECEDTSKKLSKIGLKNIVLKIKKKINSNIQKQARDERYALLFSFCKKKKVSYLLTAHHLDDQVENFYIRLTRGSGLYGLSSMKTLEKNAKGINVLRPFLNFKKKDLVYAAKKKFKNYISDPSNKNEKFLRSRIRKLKKNLSKEGLNDERILKTIHNLNSAKEALSFYVEIALKNHIKQKKYKLEIDKQLFKQEPFEIVYRSISELIRQKSKSDYPPRSKGIENLIKSIQKTGFKNVTLGGFLFSSYKNKVIMRKEYRKKNRI